MATKQRPEPESKKTAPAAEVRRKWNRKWLAVVLACGVCVAVGVVGGYLVGSRYSRQSEASPTAAPEEESAPTEATKWTCSMHPQIEMPEPGKCPICFMDLIPLEGDDGGQSGPRRLKMSEASMALADVETVPVQRRHVTNVVRMVGKVDYDETRLADITARVAGRLDDLYVDYTGTRVRKGDHLVSIYSEDLVTGQRELLQTWERYNSAENPRSKEDAQRTLDMVEKKLRRLGLKPEQIEAIKQRGTVSDHLTLYAPVGGVVIQRHTNEGERVQIGTKIYTIADLSRVWVFLDAYESDVPWIRYGQEAEFTTETFPGETFQGRVAFIDPVLNEKTRTVKVRVNVPNQDLRLKPGMFVHAIVRSRLARGGRVLDASLAGKWICPMHPEVVKDAPESDAEVKTTAFDPNEPREIAHDGIPTCDICGMDLVPAEEVGLVAPDQAPEPPLVIPVTAPLLTGKRAVVYVRLPDGDQPTFEGREVLLGPRAGDYYVVRHGLKEGERVVTKGSFKIDSALQLRTGKLSMMSPADGTASAGEKAAPQLEVPDAFRASLSPLYQAYLAAGKALADDNPDEARKSIRALLDAARQVDAESAGTLSRLRLADVLEILSRWKRLSDRAVMAAEETMDAKDQAGAREQFAELSEAVAGLVRSFGHNLAEPVYRAHCPMAFDGQGADWLQTGREIRNPYYGHAMLGCGNRTAAFYPQRPLENVSAEFRRQLTGLYGEYLRLQEALADDRLSDALAAWQGVLSAVDRVGSDPLDEPANRTWQAIREDLQQSLKAGWKDPNIDQVREQFEAVSTTMLSLVNLFGHAEDAPLYRAFCPMAFDNKGAAWLQAGEKIANPYFGHQMLRCGEIQHAFAAAGTLPVNENSVREEPQ